LRWLHATPPRPWFEHMQRLTKLLKEINATPAKDRKSHGFRDKMYELSVLTESLCLTIPDSLLNHTERETLTAAQNAVELYYTTNLNSVGVTL